MRPRVVALGEILWDLLPAGRMLGGAPANFAYHAHVLGADTRIATRIGDDALGQEILHRLQENELSVDAVQVDARAPTGTVSVEIEADGQPRYVIHEDVAWDFIEVTPGALAILASAETVCFGSLAQRSVGSRESIRALVAAAPATALRIFDINLRQSYYDRETVEASLQLANVLKLNDAELPVMAAMFGLTGPAPEQLATLAQRFDLRAVALTLGRGGSLLRVGAEVAAHPGIAVNVRDTIGAGDAFTAVLCYGLLSGWSPATHQREREHRGGVCLLGPRRDTSLAGGIASRSRRMTNVRGVTYKIRSV